MVGTSNLGSWNGHWFIFILATLFPEKESWKWIELSDLKSVPLGSHLPRLCTAGKWNINKVTYLEMCEITSPKASWNVILYVLNPTKWCIPVYPGDWMKPPRKQPCTLPQWRTYHRRSTLNGYQKLEKPPLMMFPAINLHENRLFSNHVGVYQGDPRAMIHRFPAVQWEAQNRRTSHTPYDVIVHWTIL